MAEIKVPGGRLTDDELAFARAYPGPLVTVHSVDEVVDWAREEGMIE